MDEESTSQTATTSEGGIEKQLIAEESENPHAGDQSIVNFEASSVQLLESVIDDVETTLCQHQPILKPEIDPSQQESSASKVENEDIKQ